MSKFTERTSLLLSLQRGLLGAVHPQLREASIEADGVSLQVYIRFEYDGEPTDQVKESCSCAASEVIADYPAPWNLVEQHISAPLPLALSPLEHIAYQRAEPQYVS